jgi:hypothetical protein
LNGTRSETVVVGSTIDGVFENIGEQWMWYLDPSMLSEKDREISMKWSKSIELRGFGPLANYPTKRPQLVGEVVPAFADRECCVVSATHPPGR